ncbi:AraC family transcriptional regulator [Microbacterium hydrocarbonoxydans]|uniref:AraC family transcriptional regulator n=1 Tax=Microbacterium hydrocarbonoxydans TaxID=273678 RepID=UPI00203D1E7E|nr:AraC family transcriptional regulator [Microbacterium hydrocarbonoxydans]MCM3778877.1 AraC family transcriptional regulator [Microbacterium hydrocarbonoxydans]
MPAVDRLTPLLARFRVHTRLFHTGPLCGVTAFPAEIGRGFLHVLREGEMEMEVSRGDGSSERIAVTQPSLLFFPRPTEHVFVNAPTEGSDFACATVELDGGAQHPLVRALPSVVVLPLDEIASLRPALDLLFAEVDSSRCGHPILIDRLFEVVLIQLLRWMLDNPERLALPSGLLSGLADERLARALSAVHEAPGEPWTLHSLARAATMSRSAFAARFKDVVGTTPADYLTEWRLTIAQEQLRAGTPVGTIATDLGYASASAFSRAFSQRLGCSPRAWLALAA